MTLVNLHGLNGFNVGGLVREGARLGSGLIRSYYINNIRVLQEPKTDYDIANLTNNDVALYTSSLGTPVLIDLTFEAGSYVDVNGNTINYDPLTLETVLVTIHQTKTQVKTKINGRPGTVKQFIADGDFELTINGILTAPNGQYPKINVGVLKNILKCNMPIQVTSWYLHLWDITQVVIDEYDVPQQEGWYSQQEFSITASSDQDVEFRQVPPVGLAAVNALFSI